MEMSGAMMTSSRQGNWANWESGKISQIDYTANSLDIRESSHFKGTSVEVLLPRVGSGGTSSQFLEWQLRELNSTEE